MKTVKAIDFPEDAYVKDVATIAQTIKAARTQSGLRIEDVAGIANVSLQTMVNIESGHAGVSIGKILHVAHCVGVSLFAVPSSTRARVSTFITTETNFPKDTIS